MLWTNDHTLSCLNGGSASVACAVDSVDFGVAYFSSQYNCLLLSCGEYGIVCLICGCQGLVGGPTV